MVMDVVVMGQAAVLRFSLFVVCTSIVCTLQVVGRLKKCLSSSFTAQSLSTFVCERTGKAAKQQAIICSYIHTFISK